MGKVLDPLELQWYFARIICRPSVSLLSGGRPWGVPGRPRSAEQRRVCGGELSRAASVACSPPRESFDSRGQFPPTGVVLLMC